PAPAPRPLPALFPARFGPQLEVLLLPHQVAEAERRKPKAGETLLRRHAGHVAGDRFSPIVDERAAVKPGPLLGVTAPPDMPLLARIAVENERAAADLDLASAHQERMGHQELRAPPTRPVQGPRQDL